MLVNRIAESLAGLNEMSPCDAGKNEMIGGSSLENTVLNYMDIAVRALCNSVASVKNGFVTAELLCSFGSHNAGDKVKRFDVAMEKSCVFHCGELNFCICINNIFGYKSYPHICFALGENMVSDACAASKLPINEIFARIHF